MKKIILIFCIIVVTCLLNEIIFSKEINDWIKDGLKGRVMEKIDFFYSISILDNSTNLNNKIITRYNNDGYKIEIINYEKQYLDYQKRFKYYNKMNKLKESIVIVRDNMPNNTNIYRYKHFKKEKAIKVTTFNSKGNIESENITKFDNNGNKIKYTEYNSSMIPMSEYNYVYNDQDQLVEYNCVNTYGDIFEREVYKYDAKGNKIELIRYKPDNTFNIKLVYKYNKSGQLFERLTYASKIPGMEAGLKLTHKELYNSYGDKIKIELYSSKDKIRYSDLYTYKYDSKENKIEIRTYSTINEFNSNRRLTDISRHQYKYWK